MSNQKVLTDTGGVLWFTEWKEAVDSPSGQILPCAFEENVH